MNVSHKHSVIIAEDEYLIAEDVANAATKAGYEVLAIAPDGEQALQLIREHAPDVAILDIKMPRMDGLEAARRIREQFSIPVIIMTAYESKEFLDAAREAGVGAYLTKPATASTLQRAMSIALARHQDLMELRRVNAELQVALAEVKTLQEFLPICCYCKKIRDDEGYWNQLETYIQKHTNTMFSHGICPDCMKEQHAEVYDKLISKE